MNSLLQADYDVLLNILKQEHGWNQEDAESFTSLVNYLLQTEHRTHIITTITESARNIRASRNELTLALIKAKRNV